MNDAPTEGTPPTTGTPAPAPSAPAKPTVVSRGAKPCGCELSKMSDGNEALTKLCLACAAKFISNALSSASMGLQQMSDRFAEMRALVIAEENKAILAAAERRAGGRNGR